MTKPETISLFQDALCSAGYERGNVRKDYEFFDPNDRQQPVRSIPLAAFGGYPRNYSNARIGIVLTNEPGEAPAFRNCALGAPLVLTVREGIVQPWAMSIDGVAPAGEPFALEKTARVFQKSRDVWGPEALGRVKTARGVSVAVQTDIFDTGLAPALARKFQERLKEQLELSFAEIAEAYRSEHGREPEVAPLFAFLFRFVTAKIFMDRRDAKGWDKLDKPLEILEAAERHTGLLGHPTSDFRRKRILAAAWESIRRNLHFQNLSVPDLASWDLLP